MYQSQCFYIIYNAAIGFNQLGNQLNHTSRCIKFTIFLCSGSCINLKEIFIDATNQIFFLEALLINLIHVIDQILNLGIARSKRRKECIIRISVLISG